MSVLGLWVSGCNVEVTTLVEFSKLVSDSSSSEQIFSALGQTVVGKCGAAHAFVFGTTDGGDFTLLSSYGACSDKAIKELNLEGAGSVTELRNAVAKACKGHDYDLRALPLISDARLFGAIVVLHFRSEPLRAAQWTLVEGLTELTAISLNKTYQHQKLQRAFDDLRLSQDALVRTEKLRALGQMSATIAHDLKNMLNPLLLYSDLIRDAAGDREEVLELSENVDRILTRGLETVDRLRDFSRQSSEDAEGVLTNLNSMVGEAIAITRPKFGDIELSLQLGALPMALIRQADCVTAIVNLLVNAMDALQGKGVVTVRTGVGNGMAWVEVQDNGPGMSGEVKARVFEPFFTTKGASGTGLGLSTLYAFTQRYGGRLEVESEPGRGARFRMLFPAAQA